ncbi:MAG: TrkH family potassium uptake protein [Actinobacteria bacterium]|nr:TrkH family potassium uptake protein [Actinomycetota bacterium]
MGGAFNLVGALTKYLSLAFLLPVAVAVWYREAPWPFLAAGALTAAVGVALERFTQGKERIGAREGFLVVSLTWAVAAAAGALPYLLAGEEQLANPIDAYFEAMSGFTTTGATILTDVEGLSRSLAMWRQFTQWLGGMGIIVLALAVLPRLRVGGRQLFESEAPGPEVEPLTTSIRETARRLWVLYIGFTALLIAALTAFAVTGIDERMSFYDAVAHAFTTMPTGGFSTDGRSLEPFGAASQWTIAFFMALAGANFALLYAGLLRRRPGVFARDEEFRLYVALLALGSLLVFVELVTENLHAGEAAVRHAVFQSVSMMTTTGFASTDFNEWTALALVILIGLMFVGGSAGSTAGSVKVIRHLLIGRVLRRELDQTVHPELVAPIRMNRVAIEERTLRAIVAFVLLYIGLFAVGTLAIMLDSAFGHMDVTPFEAIAAAATTLGNVGPGVGFAGPMGSFEPFSPFSKVVMIALMWLGRLEIIPILVLFTRSYWR